MTLYVVGQTHQVCEHGTIWSFQAIFDDQRDAEEYAVPNRYWVGPVELATPLPPEPVEWPGSYYPHLKES